MDNPVPLKLNGMGQLVTTGSPWLSTTGLSLLACCCQLIPASSSWLARPRQLTLSNSLQDDSPQATYPMGQFITGEIAVPLCHQAKFCRWEVFFLGRPVGDEPARTSQWQKGSGGDWAAQSRWWWANGGKLIAATQWQWVVLDPESKYSSSPRPSFSTYIFIILFLLKFTKNIKPNPN